MFYYEVPQFEKKRLLRTEMLEQIRDLPRDYLEILYAGYSDGILYGCTPRWTERKLVIGPGILRYHEHLYFMKEPFQMRCENQDKIRYLKVQFQTPVKENGSLIGKTRIYLDSIVPDPVDEIELCRFRLQEGARLRYIYENFADCITEFDTIHLVNVPWASPEKPSLHPIILKQFAVEIVKKRDKDALDSSFAINILANKGIMTEDAVRMYIDTCIGNEAGKGNEGLYYGLMEILKTRSSDSPIQKRVDGTQRQIVLL